MKLKIFNAGYGWYIPAFNYKNDDDRKIIKLFFPKNSQPTAEFNASGKAILSIDAIEGKFTCYEGNVGLTVFKYNLLDEAYMPQESGYETTSGIPEMNQQDHQEYEYVMGSPIDEEPQMEMEELPFY